jgi:putative ABC transport system permease protein
MKTLLRELRFGIRGLKRRSLLSFVVILTLATAIGVSIALFSLVDIFMFHPVSGSHLDRLVIIWGSEPMAAMVPASGPDYLDWKRNSRAFDYLVAFDNFAKFNVTGIGAPLEIRGSMVVPDFFRAVGVSPIAGRDFLSSEDQEGKNQVVILSYGFWREQFAGNSNLSNLTLTLNGRKFDVIGVMPSNFSFPGMEAVKLWIPLSKTPLATNAEDFNSRDQHWLKVVGLLKGSVSMESAQTEMVSIATQLQKDYPTSNRNLTLLLYKLKDWTTKDVKPLLIFLLTMVVLIVILGTVNVMQLQMAQFISRQKEIVIRQALGAGSFHSLRHFIIEFSLLVIVAVAIGMLLAPKILLLLPALQSETLPALQDAGLNGDAILFALLIALCMVLPTMIWYTVQASRVRANDELNVSTRTSSMPVRSRRQRRILIACETAVVLPVLISAALTMKSFLHLTAMDPGVAPHNLLTMQIELPQTKYSSASKFLSFEDTMLQKARALPGVHSAAVANYIPFGGLHGNGRFIPEQSGGLAEISHGRIGEQAMVSPGYFETMGIPLLKGRDFTDADKEGSELVAIISNSIAKFCFSHDGPLGKRIVLEGMDRPLTIVGVAGDVKRVRLNENYPNYIYMPLHQMPDNSVFLLVRASASESLMPSVRSLVQQMDREQPVYDVQTMQQRLESSFTFSQLSTTVLGMFALLALILAGAGIYGSISFYVAQSKRDIGIQMALGARKRDVLINILQSVFVCMLLGSIVGVVLSYGMRGLMVKQLVNVSPLDPAAMLGGCFLLIITGVATAYFPASRATHLDPLVVLRGE